MKPKNNRKQASLERIPKFLGKPRKLDDKSTTIFDVLNHQIIAENRRRGGELVGFCYKHTTENTQS